jgi:hypothetical protein
MQYLDLDSASTSRILEGAVQQKALPISDHSALNFCVALSKELLKNKRVRDYPSIVAFAFFCRQSNLKKILSEVNCTNMRIGWGCILHIPPSNVPINAMFSMLMGLLSGNSNIVRLPSSNFPEVRLVIDVIIDLLERDEFKKLRDRLYFVKSSRSSEALVRLISFVDGVLVWGGDVTAEIFRKFPKKNRAVEIYFTDRSSSAVLSCLELENLNMKELNELFRKFYNDTLLFDQLACSSPQKIFWMCDTKNYKKIQVLFWNGFSRYLYDNNVNLNQNIKTDKMINIISNIQTVKSSIQVEKYSDAIWTIENSSNNLNLNHGVFQNVNVNTLAEIAPWLNTREQTLCYFGINKISILEHALDTDWNIDRIVPIGSALDMKMTWDGINVLERLSRIVDLQ